MDARKKEVGLIWGGIQSAKESKGIPDHPKDVNLYGYFCIYIFDPSKIKKICEKKFGTFLWDPLKENLWQADKCIFDGYYITY